MHSEMIQQEMVEVDSESDRINSSWDDLCCLLFRESSRSRLPDRVEISERCISICDWHRLCSSKS